MYLCCRCWQQFSLPYEDEEMGYECCPFCDFEHFRRVGPGYDCDDDEDYDDEDYDKYIYGCD